MRGNFPPSSSSSMSSMPITQLRPSPLNKPNGNFYSSAAQEEMLLLESAARPPPPPPAPPSTPVVKQHPATQKYHHQLLQQLPSMLANGMKLCRPEDYVWLDPSGRPASPPRPMTPQNKAQNTRKVAFDLVVNDNLGLMIRGGIEYGLGIYITGVDQESAAYRNGLRVGDEIVHVNGKHFDRLTHDEAVNVLKSSHRLTFLVRYMGKVPHSSLVPNRLTGSSGNSHGTCASNSSQAWAKPAHTLLTATASLPVSNQQQQQRNEQLHNGGPLSSPKSGQKQQQQSGGNQQPPVTHDIFRGRRFSCGDGAEAEDAMNDDLQRHRSHYFSRPSFYTNGGSSAASRLGHHSLASGNGFARRENATSNAFDENGDMTSPELSLVLEKAVVLLNGNEFSALRRILAEYEATEINVDTFAENLQRLITDKEKASFFTEIREVVRQEDLIRFDRLIFGRRGNLFDMLLADSSTSSVRRHSSVKSQPQQQQPQHQPPINDLHADFGMADSSMYDYGNDPGELYSGEDRINPSEENGYGPLCSKVAPPLYIQRRDSYEGQQVHPSIAGFPSHARKPHRSVTFKGSQTIHIPKCCSSLGIAIEGGTNTLQPLPRIISIQPNGAAYQNSDLRVGQLIKEVDGFNLTGLPHETVAKLIAECFAKRNKETLTLLVMDQKLTPAEMRRSLLHPQS